MVIVAGDNATSASSAVANSWNLTVLGATQMTSSNCASKCILMAWVCVAPLRVTEIHHTTVMHWIRAAGHQLNDAPESEEIPEITDLDELQTFVGNKRHKIWIGCAVNHKQAGILAWVIGDPLCEDLSVLVEHRPRKALFLVCHGWLVGVSDVH